MGARDELCGRSVGEFVLREKIGEGAYGAVYRCEQPTLGREAVIKVLHGKLRTRQVMLQRFLREARLASRLDHPYAAHVYAFGVEKDDGLLWIAMEMVHGTPLDRWLQERGPLKLTELVPFFERIAEVVQTGHEHGIVHRDLKPSNVMVMERAGRLLPKLLDFGIAKLLVEDSASEPALPLPDLAPEDGEDGEGAPGEPAAPAPLKELTLADSMEVLAPGVPLASDLTVAGMVMGSPPYMAPEQWAGDDLGPHTDLYALGVLAYEALTGRRPFEAALIDRLAAMHAHEPVPPLGGDHPAALDRFFARAMAKRPEDRPSTALELAAALRVASGLAEDPAELPRLERGLHDAWIADAPQPLAEAVAALEGARNPHQARDAARELFRTLVRYLLALTLASRAQVRDARTDPGTDALLRELGRRALDDAERVSLMRQLVRPLAGQRGAYPIPPLVDLLVPDPGQDNALDAVIQLAVTTDARGGGDDLLRSRLAQLVLALGRLLRAASFVLDYRLVVVRAGACESWMGLRRAHRRALAIRGIAPPERQPALVDRDDRSVLVLWPLAQSAPPAPAAEAELFLFDGPDRRGARLVAAPHGFTLHDPALWDWLGEHALARPDDPAAASAETRAPYLGLEAFSVADADRFVGREREVDALANRLRTTPLQVVVGASGAGKSSFIHAGLVAALPPGSRVIAMRPGGRPLATLATRLGAAGVPAAEVRALLESASAAAADAAPAAASALIASVPAAGSILVVIDQLEELFTMCRDEAERARFATVVDALASAPEGRIRVIGTLRDDFMMRAAGLPVLGPRMAGSVFFLGNPSREDLIRTIIEPARRAGYELSDAELAPEMADAVAGRPGALALLSFTASRLWELRDRQFHRLTRRAYEAMGGVGGALGQHAEQTIAELSAEERRLVREAFRHLVTAEGTRAQLSVAELREVLGGPGAGAVIDKLVAARLLVVAEQEDGARVEIVHEALLTAWPRAQQWLREDADSAQMRDQLRAAARQWHERGRARGLLWPDEPLAELERWRARHEEHGLTEVERAFADASRAAAARGRRLRRLALGSAFAVLAVALAIMFWLRGEATRQRELANARAQQIQAQLAGFLIERGQQALLAGNVGEALEALEAAQGQGGRSPALGFMLARARESKEAELATLGGHAGPVWSAAFSPDGARVLTAGKDAAVRIWDAATGRELHVLGGHAPPVVAAWSPRGEVATFDTAGTLRLWTGDGRLRAERTGGRGAATRIAFTHDGARLAIARADGHVVIGDPSAGTLLATWKADPSSVEEVAFDASGARLVTGGRSGAATIWSIEGRALAKLEGHAAAVWRAAFDPAGDRVVTASLDGTVRIWDARTGAALHRLVGHEGGVIALALDAQARRIATASTDATARLWNLDTGDLVATLRGHTARVTTVGFAPDDQLVTASSDGTARVWDLVQGVQTASYHHGGFIAGASVDPAARRLATASWSGTAKLWDLRRQSRLQVYAAPAMASGVVAAGRLLRIGSRGLAGWELASSGPPWIWSGAGVLGGALSSDGRTALAFDAGGDLHVLDERGKLRRRLQVAGKGAACVATSPDGRRAAVCDPGGAVTVWNLETGAQIANHPTGPVNIIHASQDGSAMVALQYVERTRGKAAAWLLVGDLSRAVRLDHPAGLLSATFSPDGARLATLSHDDIVRIWTRDGRLEAELPHTGLVWTAAWSSDGSWLATGTAAGTLTIWERSGWRVRKAIEAHVTFISALAIDKRDTLIASSDADGIVKLWDVEQLLQVARFPTGTRAQNLAFDGDQLLVSGPLTTQAWRCDRHGF